MCAAPGGKTTINISLTDANSRGVVGEELNVMSSSGSIGKLQDRGSGQYSVTLIAPDSGATSVTVVVQSASGDLRKELDIEIVGGTATETVVAEETSTESSTSTQTNEASDKPENEGGAQVRDRD